MWSPIYQMLAICVLGLTVLGASADIYPVHPTEADLVSKGQCYSYIDGMNYSIAASLQPCMEKCPGTETVECVPPVNATLFNSSDYTFVFSDKNGSLWEIGNCVCNYATKQVIPDLNAIGYTITSAEYPSDDDFNSWFVKYAGNPTWAIDLLGVPNGANQADTILVQAVYNKGNPSDAQHPGDTNPNKRPLRDIMLSVWQQGTGRSVRGLSKFKYWEVQEVTTVAAVPRAYAAMGKVLDDNERNAGVLVVTRNGQRKGESDAYKIMRGTAFAIGIKKITQEYAEFNQRNIAAFTIMWSYGSMDMVIELSS